MQVGRIENVPLESKSVDVVTSNCVINLVPDKKRAFTEIYRVLKYGGTITMADIVSKEPIPDRVRNDLQKWSECVSGALSIEELERKIAEAGFVDFHILEEAKWDKTEDQELQLASITFYALKSNDKSA
ncbi:MAG: methyltransferase domain-containing protein [Nitrososphaerota archaeon]|nr:methyltransferase domain-containing protein [Nitrososphaerota archaeon]MDG6923554.1 methyltransferase domain-containing protein [Nitrososphaerota archaeon]